MNQLTDTLRDSKRLRLIATALELMQYERTDSAVIPIPGTEPQRYVAVGSAETVARLLEIAPTAQEVTQQAANAETAEQARHLTMGEAFKAVGGWMNGGELGYPSFGSMNALWAYTVKMIRAYIEGQSGRTQNAPFPERDQSKPVEQQGLFRKFDVRRVDGSDQPGGKHYGCRYYVLDLTHDQHAPVAMRAYAAACRVTHPQLAADIKAEFGVQDLAPTTSTVSAPEEVRDALERIKQMTDADDPESYRCDDREGCLDTVFAVASEALRTTSGKGEAA